MLRFYGKRQCKTLFSGRRKGLFAAMGKADDEATDACSDDKDESQNKDDSKDDEKKEKRNRNKGINSFYLPTSNYILLYL